jgi:hypothetical protein
MRGKGSGVSLHERIHGTPPPVEQNESRSAPAREPCPSAIRHCWVTDEQGRLPGLLLEWRRTTLGWQGRVVRPMVGSAGWIIVEEWLPAELLEHG